MSYESTNVPAERTQQQIRELPAVKSVEFHEKDLLIACKLILDKKTFLIFLPVRKAEAPKKIKKNASARQAKKQETLRRSAWRALFWSLKAWLDGIARGIEIKEIDQKVLLDWKSFK